MSRSTRSFENRRTGLLAVAVVVSILLLGGSLTAGAGPRDSSVRAPKGGSADPVDLEAAFPAMMTDAQMEAFGSGAPSPGNSGPTGHGSTLKIASEAPILGSAASDRCLLNVGRMWGRTSGGKYNFGTVGAKPRLYDCTHGVVKTYLASEVYMHNGWFWFRAAGPFRSYGTGDMTQKKVEYVCRGKGRYPFYVTSLGWGMNRHNQAAVARAKSAEYKFNCG